MSRFRGPQGRLHFPRYSKGCWKGDPATCCVLCWARLARASSPRIRTDGGLPDDSSMRCWNCERVIDRRHIGYHEVPIHDEEDGGYDMVPVPICEECQLRWYGVECSNCGDYHWDVGGVFECKRDRPRTVPDGGIVHRPDAVTGDVECPECGFVEEGPHLGGVLCPNHLDPVVMKEIDEEGEAR